jgi:hypothetical protein
MRLYSGMSPEFLQDSVRNQIADKLSAAFFNYYRYRPSPQEINSWRNSLRAMAQIVDHAHLNDHGILLEYQLPLSSKRLDCMVCGQSGDSVDNAVIVELKQWDKCGTSETDLLVSTWVGGRQRDILHPAVQVAQYHQYLADTHTAFHEERPVQLSSCSYLHNYSKTAGDALFAPKFASILESSPVFDADGALLLSNYLKRHVGRGKGRSVLDRVEGSKYRPSRKLMEHVAETIRSKSPWVLLDEQLVVYQKILGAVRAGVFGRRKQAVIVKGGPGTGKSVLAINLLADLLRLKFNAHYATGSRAFTETLWDIVGSKSKPVFRYFNNYGQAEHNSIDVLICDESHRIRETSNSRFTRREHRSNLPQIEEILKAAKVAVFFIDDKQVVRPNEIGSTGHILSNASRLQVEVSEYELEIQFRCSGSDGFINWVNNTLGVQRTANVLWDGADGFDFKIVDSPLALENAMRQKAAEGYTARVAAGFCWPWSEPRSDGTLIDDVVIGDYRRPWDAKPGSRKLAPGIPSASLWATDPSGINQIGCVYNIQGFELDYVGVIWGLDLRYDFDQQKWIGDKTESQDSVVKRSKEKFVELVQNTYRVLLSRGMKGCYVHFMDKDTERFVRSRMDTREIQETYLKAAEPPATYKAENPPEDQPT